MGVIRAIEAEAVDDAATHSRRGDDALDPSKDSTGQVDARIKQLLRRGR